MTSVTLWDYCLARVSRFCHKNWYTKFVQSPCHKCSVCEQKQHLMNMSCELIELLQTDADFLSQFIACNWKVGLWVMAQKLSCNHPRKRTSCHFGKKPCQFKWNIKSLLICFLNIDGVIPDDILVIWLMKNSVVLP